MTDRIPVIDLAPIISGDSGVKTQAAMELGSAAQTLGFAVIAGHGINPTIGTELRDTALQFFDLPLEEKMVIRRPKNDQNRGYIPYGEETLVRMAGGDSPPDYKEVFSIGPDSVP
ncbi:MAG: 2-oxoglutarate and iron-dependent oxygenase domain-containing protein, partial [Pseudomonadales bacterium]|nr:2-oxoglutarate and iron-dependent oxygenase domain-containing protein [Pseudomonadales bacterium]